MKVFFKSALLLSFAFTFPLISAVENSSLDPEPAPEPSPFSKIYDWFYQSSGPTGLIEPLFDEVPRIEYSSFHASKPVVLIYNSQTTKSSVLTAVNYGTLLSVVDNRDERWAKVKTEDGIKGWVLKKEIQQFSMKVAESDNPFEGKKPSVYLFGVDAVMTQAPITTVNFIREPGHKERRPLLLPYGVWLEVTNTFPTEVEVKLMDGTLGYIQTKEISYNMMPLTRSEMIELAKTIADLPVTYMDGGATTFGFDSGGFIQFLFNQMHIRLPRRPQDQKDFDDMKPIFKSDLRVGDLVFLGDSEDKITNSGLYLGDDKFIYAGHIDKNYWSKRTGPSYVCICNMKSQVLKDMYPTMIFRRYTHK